MVCKEVLSSVSAKLLANKARQGELSSLKSGCFVKEQTDYRREGDDCVYPTPGA